MLNLLARLSLSFASVALISACGSSSITPQDSSVQSFKAAGGKKHLFTAKLTDSSGNRYYQIVRCELDAMQKLSDQWRSDSKSLSEHCTFLSRPLNQAELERVNDSWEDRFQDRTLSDLRLIHRITGGLSIATGVTGGQYCLLTSISQQPLPVKAAVMTVCGGITFFATGAVSNLGDSFADQRTPGLSTEASFAEPVAESVPRVGMSEEVNATVLSIIEVTIMETLEDEGLLNPSLQRQP